MMPIGSLDFVSPPLFLFVSTSSLKTSSPWTMVPITQNTGNRNAHDAGNRRSWWINHSFLKHRSTSRPYIVRWRIGSMIHIHRLDRWSDFHRSFRSTVRMMRTSFTLVLGLGLINLSVYRSFAKKRASPSTLGKLFSGTDVRREIMRTLARPPAIFDTHCDENSETDGGERKLKKWRMNESSDLSIFRYVPYASCGGTSQTSTRIYR